MRIDVKKYLFVGLEEDRAGFFKRAQELGVIQFIDVQGVRNKEIPEDVQKLNAAIKVLRGLPPCEQEELYDYGLAKDIIEQILKLKELQETVLESQRITKLEIARLSIFGHFSLEDIHAIEKEGERKIQFFCGKEGAHENISPELIYVGNDQGLDYYISIAKQAMSYDKLIEMPISESLGTLENRLKENDLKIHETEERLKKYAKFNTFLHHALVVKLNGYHLEKANASPSPALDDTLFVVEGWIPKDKTKLLKRLTEDFKVHVEEIAISEKDEIPTYLENKGLNRLGEDLVHIYDTPSHTDNDPSLWVLGFFALFFGMIIGDAGYGLIYLLVGLYFYYKTPKVTKGGRRLFSLVAILCASTLLWGLLIHSFFGMTLSPDNPLRKYSLLQWLVHKKAEYHIAAKDAAHEYWVNKIPEVESASEFLKNGDILGAFSDNIMMELALLIGTIHICLSLMRYMNRNLVALGWLFAIIGAYLYLPSYLQATSMVQFVLGISREAAATQGAYLFVGGYIFAVVTSLIYNRLSGLLEIMTIIQIFSDILSYLRLYALGLAGAIIGSTVNEIAGSLGFVFGTILVIVGHTINMSLAIIGGVIHGLRLNFLEWYHYSFQGGGKQFSPLCEVEIE